jgi:hypothetical protein
MLLLSLFGAPKAQNMVARANGPGAVDVFDSER